MLTVEKAEKAALRTSSYTIYVDLPNEPAYGLLVHGYSGAYDKVARSVVDYVRSLDFRPPKPLYGDWAVEGVVGEVEAPPAETTERLKRRGYLTELSRSAERDRFDKFVAKLHERDVRKMPNYVVMPTYDCNLRCNYCFQDHMRTDARFEHLLRYMHPRMVDRIFAALPAIEQRHNVVHSDETPRSITLFGGEPLLAHNRRLIEYIVSTAQQKAKTTFFAVTNATELEHYQDLLGPHAIRTLQITIDGPPDEHDKRRIYADGAGSFARIADNIDLALSCGVHIDVRMNIDRTNIEGVPSLAKIFEARGWTKFRIFLLTWRQFTQRMARWIGELRSTGCN